MDTRFGGSSAGLLQRLRPARIDVADLLEVADTLLPSLATARLRVDMVQRSGAGSIVVVEEDERQVRIGLHELADDMTRAGVAPTAAGISAALTSWVAHRPVPDAAAAATGIAVLDWSDRVHTTVGWRVVVRRGSWRCPGPRRRAADAAEVHRTRSAASGRAHDVSLDLRVEGPVALWSHRGRPRAGHRRAGRLRSGCCAAIAAAGLDHGRHARRRHPAPSGGLRRRRRSPPGSRARPPRPASRCRGGTSPTCPGSDPALGTESGQSEM